MKKLFTIIAFLITLPILSFGKERSAIHIRFTDNRPIVVSIDGRNYNKHAASLTFGNMPAGWHSLRVYEYIEYANGGGRAKLVYTGSIRVKAGKIAYCIVDANTRRMRVRITDKNDDYVDYNAPDGVDDNDNQTRNNDFDNNGLNRQDLQDLSRTVADRITDTDKLKLMKSVLENKNYTTQDVRIMMGWLSFEASRVDFAKWSFNRVTDTHNYWKIEEDFTYSSSKDEFNKYIKKADDANR